VKLLGKMARYEPSKNPNLGKCIGLSAFVLAGRTQQDSFRALSQKP